MSRTKFVRIAVVALLLLVPISSSAKDNWTKLHSKNFTIIENAGEGDLKKLVDRPPALMSLRVSD